MEVNEYTKPKIRLQWLDNMKAISLFCVMIGHFTFFPSFLCDWYAPFFLSSFLFASGYTFHTEKNFLIFLRKKIKTLLFPWLWMGLLIIGTRVIFSFNNHGNILKEFLDFFFQIRGRGDEGWFFICLFGAEIIFYLLITFIKKKSIIITISFLLSLISIAYSLIFKGSRLPWHIQMYGSAILFLSIGYICKIYKETINKVITKKNMICSILLYAVLYLIDRKFIGGEIISFYSYGNSVVMYYILSFASLFMIFLVSQFIPNYKILSFVGCNTLLYYGLHGKVSSVYETVLFKFVKGNINVLGDLLYGTLGIVTIVIILAPIVVFINKKMPYLLGKGGKIK